LLEFHGVDGVDLDAARRSRDGLNFGAEFCGIASQRVGAKRRPMTGSATQSGGAAHELLDGLVALLAIAETLLSNFALL